ncbi:protein spire 1 [Caerostris extrusa]|uniref:Protein spire 1 n=1 Tax=Caerostris extrusa TaxID=172846 RepID=A0AAV4T386_CAEEX|nr:protein spire 1 [Caerostris extrusa]
METAPTKEKIETSRTKLEETDETPQPQRRLIKADINLGLSSSFEDLDDIPSPPDEHQSLPMQNGNRKSCIMRSNSQTDDLSRAERRHSISVCESPPRSGDQTLRKAPHLIYQGSVSNLVEQPDLITGNLLNGSLWNASL